uniref:Nucleolus and neural progenitor protein-like N-terminal domain-containing protein n=1 Tax=Daucus carota subsp. sativus TaxID=79200 RepID=A0A166B267_DAUCS
MDSDVETIEKRLKSFLEKLQVESSILDRIVYKNKNQHKHCLYFQYLVKIRSDLRLLHSAGLEEILSSLFEFIMERRSKQKLQLFKKLKRKKCDEKHNLLERLLGAARLLSQILFDIVIVFNEASCLSLKGQNMELAQDGLESLFEAMNDDSKAVLAAAEMVERAINAPVVAFQMLKLLHLYLRYDQKRALAFE